MFGAELGGMGGSRLVAGAGEGHGHGGIFRPNLFRRSGRGRQKVYEHFPGNSIVPEKISDHTASEIQQAEEKMRPRHMTVAELLAGRLGQLERPGTTWGQFHTQEQGAIARRKCKWEGRILPQRHRGG